MSTTLTRRSAIIIVFAASVALYLPSVANGFAYDDVVIIEQDARIHSPSISRLVLEPYWPDPALGLYRPLVSMSYAVDWAVSGGSPQWFHAMNTLWNALACAALVLLLCTLAPALAAFAGGLVFAAHPVHVEAVANVVGRAELMAATLTLSALWLWARSAVPRRRTTLGVATLFALALLSKESAIMLPALLILVDAARGALRPGSWRAWLRRTAPALAALMLIAVAYLALRTVVLGDLGPDRLDPALEIGGPTQQRLTALQAWPLIVRVLIIPRVLLADYGPRIILPAAGATPAALLGIAILLALVGGGVAAWRRGHGAAALALLWVPVALLPVSNLLIPIGVVLAERALYLPSAALAFAVASAIAVLATPRYRPLALGITAIVTVLFAARTLVRIPEWRSTDAIMAALQRDRPDAFRAQWHTARLAVRSGDHAAALREYARALELWPFRRGLVAEAARFAVNAGDLDYAQRLATYMLTRWPGDLDASRLLAGAALDRGDTVTARNTINAGLRVHPNDELLLRMRAAANDSLP